jgi:hypothetical protein
VYQIQSEDVYNNGLQMYTVKFGDFKSPIYPQIYKTGKFAIVK